MRRREKHFAWRTPTSDCRGTQKRQGTSRAMRTPIEDRPDKNVMGREGGPQGKSKLENAAEYIEHLMNNSNRFE